MMEVITAFLTNTLENVFTFGVMMIVTLAVVIMVHEWGHYIAARLCGVRVEKFAFGFGRELIGFGNDPKKTRFSICLFPLGGYVKLFGDVDTNNPVIWDHDNNCEKRLTDEELKTAFCTKSVWQRMFIVAAGPLINILFTIFLLVSLFTYLGERSIYPLINAMPIDSAAYEAGIEIGDRVVAMNGVNIRRLEDVFDDVLYDNPPLPRTYTILRNGKQIDISFTAKREVYTDRKGIKQEYGLTGFTRLAFISLIDGINSINGIDTTGDPDRARELIIKTLDQKITAELAYKGEGGINKTWDFVLVIPRKFNTHLDDPSHKDYYFAHLIDIKTSLYRTRLTVFDSLKRTIYLLKRGTIRTYKVIKATLKGRNDDPIISGIADVSNKVASAVKAGPYDYIMIMAIISFMVGFVNLLPIPVLDGGYLLFLFYEAVRGKPVSPRIQGIAMIIGLVLLGGIMIFANMNDLVSLISGVSSD